MTPTPRFVLVGPGGPPTLAAHMRAAGLASLLRDAFGAEVALTLAWGGSVADRGEVHQLEVKYLELAKLWRIIKASEVVVLCDDEAFVGERNNTQLLRLRYAMAVARRLQKKTVLILPPGLSPGERTRDVARALIEKADLVVSTGPLCREALYSLRVQRHIEEACDPALAVRLIPKKRTTLSKFKERRVIGLAPVDDGNYPLTGKLWGPESLKTEWPVYCALSPERIANTDELESGYAEFISHLVKASGLAVRLFATCVLTEATCLRIVDKLAPDVRYHVQISFSPSVDGLFATELTEVEYLITSNYAVALLGLATGRSLAGLCNDPNLTAALVACELKESLLENRESNSTLLQLERLFHALTFEEVDHKVAQAEYVLETVTESFDHLRAVLTEWWEHPAAFRQ